MTLYVTIDGKDREAIADLVRRYEIDILRTTVRERVGRGFRVDALVEPDRVEQLEAAGYDVDVLDEADKVSAALRVDVDFRPADVPRRPRTPLRPQA